MSASAGRVLIIPRGDYNSATTYNMLDMVFYSGKSYICKQTSTGNDPTNTVYWQIMIDGASEFSALSDVELNNLQNGDGIYYDATAQKWKNTTPTSIAITSPPATTEYSDGDILDLTGMVVTAYYAGGSTRNITGECTFTPANGSTLSSSDTAVTVTWRTFTATQTISVVQLIYGVEWDGSSSPAMTRTDTSADFVDPVPYYAGMTETPSSPFDNIMPWSGMQIVDDPIIGKIVSIPKFYYKREITNNSYKLQISPNKPDNTWLVSPAHMDRGDGQGERDVVYVGRYHVNDQGKSVTGANPKTELPQSMFGTLIHNNGSEYWMYDVPMLETIRMLYLVEYATLDSQSAIGYGCDYNNSRTTGSTDSMPYHTGTIQSSRTTYGAMQYRHIEGLWSGVLDSVKGIRMRYLVSNYRFYATKTLSLYNDNEVEVATLPSGSYYGCMLSMKQSEVQGYEYVSVPRNGTSGTNYNNYYCDAISVGSDDGNDRVLYTGGDTNNLARGIFNWVTNQESTGSSGGYSYAGTRVIKMPNAS